MKVCDLALFSPETSSGVKTYIGAKIDYVSSRHDIDHVVIVPGRSEKVGLEGRSKVIVVRGVPTFYPGIRVAVNLREVAAIIERERPDIIELNCQYTLPWAAFLATRHSRTPVVGVFHTDVAACVEQWARGAGAVVAAAARRLTELYEGLIYRHCTATIVLNPTLEARVSRLGVDRVRCLPCGVDIATFSPDRRDAAWRARHGVQAGTIAVVYAGRLSAEKEVDVLLQAYDRLPPGRYALLIAGDGPQADEVARRARTHPGVSYLGHVESRAELATIYASSDVFVSPGRNETFGMSALEALACGLPVVGIQDSGTATFVPPEIGVLARAGDPSDLARAIMDVAAWPLERLRSDCRAHAAGRYSWDTVLAQYFAVYRQLIDDTASRGRAA